MIPLNGLGKKVNWAISKSKYLKMDKTETSGLRNRINKAHFM